MTRRLTSRSLPLLMAAFLAVAAACTNPVGGGEPHPLPAGAEVLIHGERIAWTSAPSGSLQWEGGPLRLLEGEEVEVVVNFLDAAGEVLPIGGDHLLRARPAGEEEVDAVVTEDEVVHITSHGTHLVIRGKSAGETSVVFMLWHGSHADWSTVPGLPVVIEESP